MFAHLVAEDEGEGGFAESGGAAEEDVVEWLAAVACSADHDLEAFEGFALSGEVGEREGPEDGLLCVFRLVEAMLDEFVAGRRVVGGC